MNYKKRQFINDLYLLSDSSLTYEFPTTFNYMLGQLLIKISRSIQITTKT